MGSVAFICNAKVLGYKPGVKGTSSYYKINLSDTGSIKKNQ